MNIENRGIVAPQSGAEIFAVTAQKGGTNRLVRCAVNSKKIYMCEVERIDDVTLQRFKHLLFDRDLNCRHADTIAGVKYEIYCSDRVSPEALLGAVIEHLRDAEGASA